MPQDYRLSGFNFNVEEWFEGGSRTIPAVWRQIGGLTAREIVQAAAPRRHAY